MCWSRFIGANWLLLPAFSQQVLVQWTVPQGSSQTKSGQCKNSFWVKIWEKQVRIAWLCITYPSLFLQTGDTGRLQSRLRALKLLRKLPFLPVSAGEALIWRITCWITNWNDELWLYSSGAVCHKAWPFPFLSILHSQALRWPLALQCIRILTTRPVGSQAIVKKQLRGTTESKKTNWITEDHKDLR